MRCALLLANLLLAGVAASDAHAAEPAKSWTLVYRESNKWVAQEDNKPLRALMKATQEGARHFEVRLPASNRDLAVARLEVLRDLMAREAQEGILLEEVEGNVQAGTIWVGVK
jgi:hypothetical protein